MNIGDLKNENVIGAVVAVISAIFLLGFFTYRMYEPTIASENVEGSILSHHAGATGKSAASPFFKVRLKNGLIVNVVDNRVLPYTFKGPVILNKRKRQNTAGYIYTIDRKATLNMHNKASQLQPNKLGLDLRSGASRLHYGRC